MSDSISFKRLGYWSISAVCIAGALAGCEFCVPLLVALAALALIRNPANGFSTTAATPV